MVLFTLVTVVAFKHLILFFSEKHCISFHFWSYFQSTQVYESLGLVRLGQLMALPAPGLSTSVALLLQNMMNSISDFAAYRKAMDNFEALRKKREPVHRPRFTPGKS